jgi:hypothetical protein
MAEHRIWRRIKPLIDARKPSRVVLAEAHDVNGAEGFPLAEADVSDMALAEMRNAVRFGGRAHAR